MALRKSTNCIYYSASTANHLFSITLRLVSPGKSVIPPRASTQCQDTSSPRPHTPHEHRREAQPRVLTQASGANATSSSAISTSFAGPAQSVRSPRNAIAREALKKLPRSSGTGIEHPIGGTDIPPSSAGRLNVCPYPEIPAHLSYVTCNNRLVMYRLHSASSAFCTLSFFARPR